MAISADPRICLANLASSAARFGSGCLRLTPRITFQPLLSARVFNRLRSFGVSVVTAQDGAFSPLEVQNVVSTKLPPKRITPGPSVFMYWARFPVASADWAMMLASKDSPMKSSCRVAPWAVPTVRLVVAASAGPMPDRPATTARDRPPARVASQRRRRCAERSMRRSPRFFGGYRQPAGFQLSSPWKAGSRPALLTSAAGI
jgi:hypothetical protein